MKRVAQFSAALLAWGLSALLLILTLVVAVGGSEAGTRWLLTRLPQVLPVEWSLGASHGTLLDELHLEDFHLRLSGLEASAHELRLRWSPLELLRGELNIARLTAAGLRVELPATGASGDKASAGGVFVPPLRVHIEEISAVDAVLVRDGTEYPVSSLSLAARADAEGLQLTHLAVRLDQLEISGRGQLAATAPHALAAQLAWRGSLRGILRLRGEASLEGSLRDLRFRLDQSAPSPVSAEGRLDLDAAVPELTASADWQNLNWPLTGVPQWSSPSGQLEVRGSPDDYTVDLQARVLPPVPGELNLRLRGQGDRQGLRIDSLPLQLDQARAEIQGRIDWTPGLKAELAANWQDLAWPPTGEARLRSATGELTLAGGPQAYTGRLRGQLDGPGFAGLMIDTGLRGDRQGLDLADLELQLQQSRVQGAGRLDWAPAPQLALRGQWQALRWPWQAPALLRSQRADFQLDGWIDDYRITLADAGLEADWLPPVTTDIQARGDLQGLDLTSIRIRRDAVQIDAQGQVDWSERALWRFAGNWTDLRWPLDAEPLAQSPLGRFELDGDGADYRFEVDGDLLLPGLPVLATRGQAKGDAGGLLIESLQARHAATRVKAEGRLDWREGVSFQARGDWADLQWPLDAEALARSSAGDFRVDGQPQGFVLRASGPLQREDLPPARFDLEAFIEPGGMDLRPLRLQALDGESRVTGRLDWRSGLNWQLAFDADEINPGAYLPDWPGALTLAGESTGEYDIDGQQSVRVAVHQLEGRLREHDLKGSARVHWQPLGLSVDEGRLQIGDNRLQLRGTYSADPQFDLQVEAPDLAALWPDLAGRLDLDLQWQGPPTRAAIQAELNLSQLRYADAALAELHLNLRQTPGQFDASGLTLEASGLSKGAWQVQSLILEGTGLPEAHRLALRTRAPEGSLQAWLDGGWSEQAWQGTLRDLNLQAVESGKWALREASALRVGRHQARLAETCLQQQAAGVCLQGLWEASTRGEAQVTLRQIPLAAIDGWISPELRITGVADGELSYTHDAAGSSARIALLAREGEIAWGGGNTEGQRTPYHDARLDGSLQDDRLQLDMNLAIDENGSGEGQVRVGARGADGQRSLAGGVEVQLPDLQFLARLLPDVEQAEGRLRFASRLGGTLERPVLDTEARLSEGSLRLPRLGIQLRGIEMQAQQQGPRTLVLSGEMESGKGRLRTEGTLAVVSDREWPLQLNLNGEDFEAVDLPEAEILVSPQLQVLAAPGRVRLSGDLRVPRARLEIQSLQDNAVRISADEVIVGPATQTQEDLQIADSLRVFTDVELYLSEDVRFSGYGLESALVGNLNIRSAPGQSTTVQGALDLSGGRYRAFGQNLQIQRGQLVFVGPVGNPTLDLRAVRKAGNITAGLAVSGPLRNPVTRVFSEPAMAESDALAYLLTGGPSARANQRDQAVVAQAALSYGLKQALPVTRQLEEAFDLDEITLSGNTDSEESALLIGKYLTPDLYIRYSYGLIDRIGGLLLRYRLTDELALESRSGAAQALDLIYTIDTD